MSNPLVEEALQLGGNREWQPSGCLKLYKVATVGNWTDQTVEIELSFYGAKELAMAVKWGMDNGYMPSRPVEPSPDRNGTIKPVELYAPLCPIHRKAMINRGRGYFCPSKMPDGSWCKQKAK